MTQGDLGFSGTSSESYWLEEGEGDRCRCDTGREAVEEILSLCGESSDTVIGIEEC